MKVKTADLTGANLAYFVAIADGQKPHVPAWAEEPSVYLLGDFRMRPGRYRPHEDWSQSGPIIERERISVVQKHDGWWCACIYDLNDDLFCMHFDHQYLTAAMRCFVASKLGNEVEIPWELT